MTRVFGRILIGLAVGIWLGLAFAADTVLGLLFTAAVLGILGLALVLGPER